MNVARDLKLHDLILSFILLARDFAVCIHSVDLDKNSGHNLDPPPPPRYVRQRGRLMEAFAIMRQVPESLNPPFIDIPKYRFCYSAEGLPMKLSYSNFLVVHL